VSGNESRSGGVPAEWLTQSDGFVPKERYVSPAFLAAEHDRLWSHVWQIACREEEIPLAGDFVEYTIGDESVLVTRHDDGSIRAFANV
jgi:Rieske 2Fe-2S family protein